VAHFQLGYIDPKTAKFARKRFEKNLVPDISMHWCGLQVCGPVVKIDWAELVWEKTNSRISRLREIGGTRFVQWWKNRKADPRMVLQFKRVLQRMVKILVSAILASFSIIYICVFIHIYIYLLHLMRRGNYRFSAFWSRSFWNFLVSFAPETRLQD